MNKRTIVALIVGAAVYVVLKMMNLPVWIYLTAGFVTIFYIIIKHYWFSPENS